METNRLIIRTLTIKDKEDIFNNVNHDLEVGKTFLVKYVENIEDFHFERTLEYFEKNTTFYYGIELKDTHECIGMIFENERKDNIIEVGYAISSKQWNRGYTTEALAAVLDELLKRDDIDVVTAGAFKENIGSWRVMEKCGMKYTHTVENELEWLGKMHDIVYYEMRK